VFTSLLKAFELNNRLDASHYQPVSMAAERKLRAFGELKPLREIVGKGRPITNGVRGPDLLPTSYRLIRLQDCKSFFVNFDECLTISEKQFQENRRCSVRENDVIVAIGGYIGHASVATNVMPSVIGQHSALLASSEYFDSFYLAAYLNSRIGALQFQRYVSGTVQQGINLEDVREIPAPLPSSASQKYVGDKVREAGQLRRLGTQRQKSAILLLEALLHKTISEDEALRILPSDRALSQKADEFSLAAQQATANNCQHLKRQSRVTYFDLTERLDAGFYRPDFLENAKELASCGLPLERIESLCEKCNCGATPVDVEYEKDGQGLVRTSDVRPNRFQDKTVVRTKRLNVECESPVAAIAGDVLYTMSGTIGYAAVIPETTETFSFSNTIARARISRPNNPWFVAAFFNSSMGYKQSLRLTSGGIQGHVMPNPFKQLWVPVADPRIQNFIGAKLQLADKLSRLSERLVASAKLLVEALIERNVTEDELIYAHTRLEQGDESADRAILSRLYEGGWDATETRPLFPDMDAYYDILRMVEREQTEDAAK
jgi:type I restriction enzyme S subunit